MWVDGKKDNAKGDSDGTEGQEATGNDSSAPGDDEPSVKFHASTSNEGKESAFEGNWTYVIIDFTGLSLAKAKPRVFCLSDTGSPRCISEKKTTI